VIGLVLQELLGNLFNGIALLIAKPFQTGDWIQVGEENGKVVEFNWRSVKIVNRFDELIIVPNNVLGKEKFKEFVTIGFSYQDNPAKVKEVLL
jgi:small-conductance mechanosensitive channel